ncbi:hypothetical protein BRDID11002_76480 [Bradyrhizobium diazoefficiens]
MKRYLSEPKSHCRLIRATIGLAVALAGVSSDPAYADEDGVSYWLPGRFSSLAAVPAVPGWSMAEVYYHTSVSAFGNAAAAREIRVGRIPANVNVDLNLRLNAQADLVLLKPDLHVRDAGTWRTIGNRHHRLVWPIRRNPRRNADNSGRALCDDPHGDPL